MLTARFLSVCQADGTKADYIHHTVSAASAFFALCPSDNQTHWGIIIILPVSGKVFFSLSKAQALHVFFFFLDFIQVEN